MREVLGVITVRAAVWGERPTGPESVVARIAYDERLKKSRAHRLLDKRVRQLPKRWDTLIEFPQPFMHNGEIQEWGFENLCSCLKEYDLVNMGEGFLEAFFDAIEDDERVEPEIEKPPGSTPAPTLEEKNSMWGQFFLGSLL